MTDANTLKARAQDANFHSEIYKAWIETHIEEFVEVISSATLSKKNLGYENLTFEEFVAVTPDLEKDQSEVSSFISAQEEAKNAMQAQEFLLNEGQLLEIISKEPNTTSTQLVINRIKFLKKLNDPISADYLEKSLIEKMKPQGTKAQTIRDMVNSSKVDNFFLKKNQNSKNALIIDNFTVTETGLYHTPPSNSDTPYFISSPIYPEAYLRDGNNENHSLLLNLFDGEKEHKWAMPREMIVNWGLLSKTLLGLGQIVPTIPNSQRLLQEFLMIAKPKKKLRCVDKSGWHGSQYVFPDGTVIGDKQDGESVYPITQVLPEGIGQSGSLTEWQDNLVSICRGNSRMILALGVAFASPCTALINEDSGGINFKGNSSIGKTRCLMTAVSVFGSPAYIRSWKTTANALEGTCYLYNDALLPLDEFGQSDAKEAGETAYMISQGMGKGRMNSDTSIRKLKTWKVMVISTGETGLEEHMREQGKRTKAGQTVRFTDIPAEIENGYGCFEEIHGEVDGASFAQRVKDVCGKYYGTAAREYIRHLVKNQDRARVELKFYIEDFVADNTRGSDGQVKRVAWRFGLIYASLALAVKFQILGKYITDDQAKEGVIKCFREWLQGRGTKSNLESHQIIENVTGKLQEYSDSRFRSKDFDPVEEKKTFQQLWGYKDGSTFYILPNSFREHFCFGQNPTEVARTLHKNGYLEKDDKYKTFQTVHYIPAHTIKKSQTDRFYTIHLDKNEHEDEQSK